MDYIESGVAEGAKLVRDGRKDEEVDGSGYFVGPTIFDEATQKMKIWQEEILPQYCRPSKKFNRSN